MPNNAQEQYFCRACGVARFAYNWALREWEDRYRLGEPRSQLLLRRKLNAIKDEQFPWMREVTKNAPQQAIKNLGIAYAVYLENLRKAKRGDIPWTRVRKPRFKRKGERDSFRADNGSSKDRPNAVKTVGRKVKLPVIGWVRMREPLRFKGQILCATVVRQADRWYIVVVVRMPEIAPLRSDAGVVGCDLGLRTFAALFDGTTVTSVYAPNPLRRFSSKIRRLSRALSRKVRGSRNRAKARTKLARAHAKIKDIRHDALHKLTTSLVRSYRTVGAETLNVRGMQRNRRTALAVNDCCFGEFGRQLVYKAQLFGATVVLVDRWFPSSKICSHCRLLNEQVGWHLRAWTCIKCGSFHERDENAARNLYLAASSAVDACGAEGSGSVIRLDETGR